MQRLSFDRGIVFAAIAAAMMVALAGLPAAQEQVPQSDDIIAHVNAVYDGVESASGSIVRIIDYGEGEPGRSEGRFIAGKPDRLKIEFGGAVARTILYDGSMYRLYFPKDNRGYITETSGLTAQERYVLGAGLYFGNAFRGLSEGYRFSVVDTFEGNIIVKATPDTPQTFAYVLVGVSPETWTVRGIEYFDGEGRVISQTRYLEFARKDSGLFFPIKIETSAQLPGGIMVETIMLSRVEINAPLDERAFARPGDDATSWAEQPLRR